MTTWLDALMQRDAALDRAATVTRERDEARAKCDDLNARWYDSVQKAADYETNLRIERDEARAIARRLRFWAVDRKMTDAEFAEKTAVLAHFDALPWAKEER